MEFLSGLLAKFMVGKAVSFISGEIENRNQPVDMPKNIEEYGFSQSLKNRGSATAYKMNICHLYETFKADVSRDETKQEELRRPLKTRRDELLAAIAHIREKAGRLGGEIKNEIRNRMVSLRDEISAVRSNPETLSVNPANKVLYSIVLTALVFLSVFLFLFYSSTAYSAYFREFNPAQIGVVQAIFSPDALIRAYEEGLMALLFILFAPVIFFTLGLVIHLFIESGKTVWIPPVFVFAFLFDGLLAYEITEKIYDLKALQSFHEIPLYSMGLAAESMNFWIIIASGFCVYILWGILFHYFAVYSRRRDAVSEAVKSREAQIAQYESRLAETDDEIGELNETAFEYQKEISRIERELKSPLIDTKMFEQLIYGFSAGWIECLHANKFSPKLETEVNDVLDDFMKNVLHANHKEHRYENN